MFNIIKQMGIGFLLALSLSVSVSAQTLPRIGIIGAGRMGSTLAKLWIAAGYQVLLASRHPDELKPLVQSLGDHAQAVTPRQAATEGDIVVMAVPYGALPDLGKQLGDVLHGKVVLDLTNPYPGRDGNAAVLALQQGSGRTTAQYLPGTRVVRGFNSLSAATLAAQAHRSGDRVAIPLAGDDPSALAQISTLVTAAGFTPVTVGSLDSARLFQPGSALYLKMLTADQLRQALSAH
jgi:predicted dinucleotide-binding enzyme